MAITMPIKICTTFFQQVARQRPQASPFTVHKSKSHAGECFFTYWSLLGACAGWSMTASSALETSKSPSLTMAQDVVTYSTFWAMGSLLMTRNPSLIACHLSNVGAVLYHYLDTHVERFQIKTYRSTDWQCHGERTQPTK